MPFLPNIGQLHNLQLVNLKGNKLSIFVENQTSPKANTRCNTEQQPEENGIHPRKNR